MKLISTLAVMCLFCTTLTAYSQEWSWAHSVGDKSANTISNAMCLYNGTDVIVTGAFGSASVKIGPYNLNSAGRDDIFIALFNATGDCLWAARFGGSSDETGKAVAADSHGNIYLAGDFGSGSITFGTHTLQNSGGKDGFLVKINPDKDVEWALKIGSVKDVEISAIAIDSHDNIYITGNKSNDELFIIKTNTGGNKLWERSAAAVGQYFNYGKSNSIAVDDDNNCYITGKFYDKLIFDGKDQIVSYQQYDYNESNAFIAKYDANGSFVDAVAISGFYNGRNIYFSFNSLYVGGDKIEYGMGWGWPLAHSEIYLGKYSTTLNQVWLRSAGGATLYQSLDVPYGISADENGNIYQTGSFFSEGIKFGTDSLENIFNKEYYYRQIFVFKYDSSGNQIWGKAAGDIHCDAGSSIQVVSDDTFYLSGIFESAQIKFGAHTLENSSILYEAYGHLRPPNEYRNTFVFLAMYNSDGTFVPSPDKKRRFNLYPNPAGDFVWVETGESSRIGGQISVYSIDGRMVKSFNVKSGEKLITMDVGGLQRGVYLFKVSIDDNVSTYRIIKK